MKIIKFAYQNTVKWTITNTMYHTYVVISFVMHILYITYIVWYVCMYALANMLCPFAVIITVITINQINLSDQVDFSQHLTLTRS